MQEQKVVTITSQQYAHLPSVMHKLVVDALVERGEWKIVATPVKKGK
jgi:hypothetical protein